MRPSLAPLCHLAVFILLFVTPACDKEDKKETEAEDSGSKVIACQGDNCTVILRRVDVSDLVICYGWSYETGWDSGAPAEVVASCNPVIDQDCEIELTSVEYEGAFIEDELEWAVSCSCAADPEDRTDDCCTFSSDHPLLVDLSRGGACDYVSFIPDKSDCDLVAIEGDC